MSYLATFIIFSLCFIGMALGIIFAKKVLKKGCSVDPDSCACKQEDKKDDLDTSDGLLNIQPKFKNK